MNRNDILGLCETELISILKGVNLIFAFTSIAFLISSLSKFLVIYCNTSYFFFWCWNKLLFIFITFPFSNATISILLFFFIGNEFYLPVRLVLNMIK